MTRVHWNFIGKFIPNRAFYFVSQRRAYGFPEKKCMHARGRWQWLGVGIKNDEERDGNDVGACVLERWEWWGGREKGGDVCARVVLKEKVENDEEGDEEEKGQEIKNFSLEGLL